MGQIVNVYHGSPNKFDEFSFDFVGSQSGTTGAGFGLYFTEVEAEALVYGENIFECVLTLKNPIHNREISLKYNDIKRIIDNYIDVGGNNYYQNYQYNEKIAIDDLLKYSISDTEIIGSMVNAGMQLDIIMEILTSLGYTHTIDIIEPDDNISTHYIVYDLNAIQIINKYTLDTR